jgi:hypothetical protein
MFERLQNMPAVQRRLELTWVEQSKAARQTMIEKSVRNEQM